MSYLVAHLSKHHDVKLLTFEGPDRDSFYSVPETVEYFRTDKLGGRGLARATQVLARGRIMRQAAQTLKPDVIISFMVGINITVLTSCWDLGIPTVVSERIDPSGDNLGRAKELARAWTYPLAQLIVVQTRRVASYFPKSLQPKIRIIGNAVPAPRLSAKQVIATDQKHNRIVAVGRCTPQKGFDRLIDAFALIAKDYPNWDIAIIGDGPERPKLEERAAACGLAARIKITGFVSDVERELAAAQVMAFPSRNEGFPNALAEALAMGLPAVGYEGVSGVEDLIVDGKTGLLVDPSEPVTGFARAMAALMADVEFRTRLGSAARVHVLEWAPTHIFELWEKTLKEAVAKSTR